MEAKSSANSTKTKVKPEAGATTKLSLTRSSLLSFLLSKSSKLVSYDEISIRKFLQKEKGLPLQRKFLISNAMAAGHINRMVSAKGLPVFTTRITVVTSQVQTTADVTGGFSVTLNNLNSNSSWQSVFDQYRITRLTYKFVPASNVVSPDNFIPQPAYYVVVIDYDNDSVAGVNLSDLLNYDTHLVRSVTESATLSFVPCVDYAVYSGSFTSYGVEEAPWIDMASPDVAHYGSKWGITGNNSGSPTVFQTILIFVTAEVEFRATFAP